MECLRYDRLFGQIRVGFGKTLDRVIIESYAVVLYKIFLVSDGGIIQLFSTVVDPAKDRSISYRFFLAR